MILCGQVCCDWELKLFVLFGGQLSCTPVKSLLLSLHLDSWKLVSVDSFLWSQFRAFWLSLNSVCVILEWPLLMLVCCLLFYFQSKQLSHARDMENLRAKAREEALEAAKQLEEVQSNKESVVRNCEVSIVVEVVYHCCCWPALSWNTTAKISKSQISPHFHWG